MGQSRVPREASASSPAGFFFFFVHRIIARHAKTLAVQVDFSWSISRSRGSVESVKRITSRKVRRGSHAARVGGYPRRAKRRHALSLRVASNAATRSWCARASRYPGLPWRPRAKSETPFCRETNPRETRDARSAVPARTWSLSARRRRSSRAVSFPNRSALVCRRTRNRLGNGQASPGSGVSPGCVASDWADTLTRLCPLDSGPRLGVTNAGIVRSKRATRSRDDRKRAKGATGVRLEAVDDPRGRHCRGTTAAFVRKRKHSRR